MLSRSEQEKVNLEKRATDAFIRAFKMQYHKDLVFKHHNAPAKPDVSCSLSGQTIDFEIAHLYGSEEEAMRHLGRELSADVISELHAIDLSKGHDARLIAALNRILFKKSLKHYDSDRVWLVICNTHASWRILTDDPVKGEIRIPRQLVFEKVWLINDILGQDGIVQLFP